MSAHKPVLLLVANSILLAIGLLLVLFGCIVYSTWWPTLTVLVFVAGIFFPTVSGSCQITEEEETIGYHLSWVIVGIFLVVGYTIPVELFRVGIMTVGGMAMTVSGGTTILAAIALFIHWSKLTQ